DLDLDIYAPNFDYATGTFGGRSFILGQNSTVSGKAEERIWLTTTPPDGIYLVIVQWMSSGSGSESPSLKSYMPNGSLKHDFGQVDALGSQGERDTALLYYPRPPDS